MCLTEPHCGTDLGLLRTKAVPADDGSYTHHRHQDLHLRRRARPDREHRAPRAGAAARRAAGHAGHHAVHRAEVPAQGRWHARRRATACAAARIEHKMGIKASATCVMNFDDAIGWLVGRPHKGMRAMFTMMNTARLGVGMQGLGIAELAYQNALAYARDRLQGRSLAGRQGPDKAADPHHRPPRRAPHAADHAGADRGLPRAVGVGGAGHDRAERHPDPAERQRGRRLRRAADADREGLPHRHRLRDARTSAMQVFGGHGYIREHGDGAVRPRRAHHPALRGHQRRPGAGPGGPQAGRRTGPATCAASSIRVSAFLEAPQAQAGDGRPSSCRWPRPSASFSR